MEYPGSGAGPNAVPVYVVKDKDTVESLSQRYGVPVQTIIDRAIQVHGGIAFTWEHPAHLHLKRSRGSAVLLGSALDNRELLTGLVPVLTTTKGSG